MQKNIVDSTKEELPTIEKYMSKNFITSYTKVQSEPKSAATESDKLALQKYVKTKRNWGKWCGDWSD